MFSHLSRRQRIQLSVLAGIVLLLPLTVLISKRSQDIRQHASEKDSFVQAAVVNQHLTPQQKDSVGIMANGKMNDERAFFIHVASPSVYNQLEKKGVINNPTLIDSRYTAFHKRLAASKSPKPAGITKTKLSLKSVAGSASATIITSCGTITQPGSYTLTSDIGTTENFTSCLDMANIPSPGVSIDCQGHSISALSKDTNAPGVAITAQNVAGLSLSHCVVNALPSLPASYPIDTVVPVLYLEATPGTIQGNTFTGGYIWMTGFTNGIFSQNQINSTVILDNATGVMMKDNIVTNGWIFATGVGNNNSFIHNTIDGGASRGYFSDDGIAVTDQTNATISSNSIINVDDCGIESVGLLSGSRISQNTVTGAANCAIGGWYWNSWLGNTIDNNVVYGPEMFDIFLSPWSADLDQPVYYFKNNTFTNNVFNDTKSDPFSFSTQIDYQNMDPVLSHKVVLGPNIFTNNTLSKTTGSWLIPSSMFVDNGGNSCLMYPAISGNPLHCATLSPQKISPSDGQAINTLTPTLNWANTNGSQSAYLITIRATNPANGSLLPPLTATGTSIQVPVTEGIQAGMTYYWNVQLCQNSVCFASGPSWFSFTSPQPNPIPSPRISLSPNPLPQPQATAAPAVSTPRLLPGIK